jgi:quercetin dioxygenase-like cupin family protein
VDANSLPDERWQDPARGTIRFRTLISAPDTPTDSLVCGVAMMAPGETFALHSHAHPEVYFGLEGEGEVMIDGQPWHLAPGVALFIPGGAIHGIPIASQPLKWFYTFAADGFADIRYRFVHEQPEP